MQFDLCIRCRSIADDQCRSFSIWNRWGISGDIGADIQVEPLLLTTSPCRYGIRNFRLLCFDIMLESSCSKAKHTPFTRWSKVHAYLLTTFWDKVDQTSASFCDSSSRGGQLWWRGVRCQWWYRLCRYLWKLIEKGLDYSKGFRWLYSGLDNSKTCQKCSII